MSTITITLTDAAGPHENRPLEVRVRAVSELLLRGYGLRCVNIRPADPDECTGPIDQYRLDSPHAKANEIEITD
jgi:hypothetical protein